MPSDSAANVPLTDLPLALVDLRGQMRAVNDLRRRSTLALMLLEAAVKFAVALRVAIAEQAEPLPGNYFQALGSPKVNSWLSVWRLLDDRLAKLEGPLALCSARTPATRALRNWTRAQNWGNAPVSRHLEEGLPGICRLFVKYLATVLEPGETPEPTLAQHQAFEGQLDDFLATPTLFGGALLAVARLGPKGRQWTRLTGYAASTLATGDATVSPSAVEPDELCFVASGLAIATRPIAVAELDSMERNHVGLVAPLLLAERLATRASQTDEAMVYFAYEEGRVVQHLQALKHFLAACERPPDTTVSFDVREGTGVCDYLTASTLGDTTGAGHSTGAGGSSGALPSHAEEPELAAARKRLGSTIAGKYELDRLLGIGAMGAVFEARHSEIDRPVALKLLHPQYARSEQAVKRFRREAKQAAATDHPGIVNVIDFGRDENDVYLVMEKLEGRPLDDVMDDGPMPIERVVALACSALDALAAAHARNLIHRDLKPQNLFVMAPAATSTEVKLLDFGIAKLTDGDTKLTATGYVLGTPAYMPLEQLHDPSSVDQRADVYGMGVTLYEMLVGELPVEVDSVVTLVSALVNDKIQRHPKELRPEIPLWLDGVVARAMAREPADRFSDAAEMRDALLARDQGSSFAPDGVAARTLATHDDSLSKGKLGWIVSQGKLGWIAGALAGAAALTTVLVVALTGTDATGGKGSPSEPASASAGRGWKHYPRQGFSAIKPTCKTGVLVFPPSPRGDNEQRIWLQESLIAHPEIALGGDDDVMLGPNALRLTQYRDGQQVRLIASCNGQTCNDLAAMLYRINPILSPSPRCQLPEALENRSSKNVNLLRARGKQSRADYRDATCARLTACYTRETDDRAGWPGLDCARQPTSYNLTCANHDGCDSVVKCHDKWQATVVASASGGLQPGRPPTSPERP